MRHYIVACLTILHFACSKSQSDRLPPEPVKNETTVKVMTYNIYGARAGGIPDLKVIAEVIKRADPDLLALQEVDKFTDRNKSNGDIAKELALLTGMNYFFAKAINVQNGEYGDAILSKLPMQERAAYNLEVDPTLGGERRSVASVLIKKDDKAFYFISTHFDHLGDERNRIKQANDFVSLAKSFDKPVIVGADLNCLPTSNPMNILRKYFSVGCLNGNCDQFTFPTTGANRTIDYLLYAPINAVSPKAYTVYTWANKESDHFPVLATFKIN